MPLSHTCADGATSRDHLDESLSELAANLRRLSQCAPGEQDFERYEREAHQLFAAAEQAVLAAELERLDIDQPEVSIEGRRHRRVLRATETYTSAVGAVTVKRTLYRAGTAPAVVPLELRAGIIGGHWTPLAARQASYLVAHLTPRESAAVLGEMGNMNPSASSLDRLPKQLNERWEGQRETFEEALRAGSMVVPEEATTLAASLDGVMAPMRDGARQQKRALARAAGRATKGPAGYREVGCGTVSFYDADGERLSTLRCGRMPEAGKATLKEMLSTEVEAALEQRPDLRVVKLADAARDNWSFLGQLAPQAASSEELVDFFHAAEQTDVLRGGGAARIADRLGRSRCRVQNAGHRTHEAVGDALARGRRPSDPLVPWLGSEWSLRDRMVVTLGNLSARSNRLRRHRVDPRPCRLNRQFETHTHTDRCPVQLRGTRDAQRPAPDETLSVVVVDPHERQAQVDVARQRPCGVARQHVDLTRLQRREAGLPGQVHEIDRVRIAEHRRRQGAAVGHVEAGPVASVVSICKPRQTGVDAALQHPGGLHVLQRAGIGGHASQRYGQDSESAFRPAFDSHVLLPGNSSRTACRPSRQAHSTITQRIRMVPYRNQFGVYFVFGRLQRYQDEGQTVVDSLGGAPLRPVVLLRARWRWRCGGCR